MSDCARAGGGNLPDEQIGIRCPKCRSGRVRVYYTRKRTLCIMRRRKCIECGATFTTHER